MAFFENHILRFYASELKDFKSRRISHFKKNLVDLAEFELKHARVSLISPYEILYSTWCVAVA